MASTWRSNQSLTAWLVAHTSGPLSSTPMRIRPQWPASGTPEAMTPQLKAHMGGNQVTGFSSSAIAEGAGKVTGADRAEELIGASCTSDPWASIYVYT